MHPVPPLADLDWLRGDRLDVVTTAQFTLWFAFDSTGVVQADNAVELVDGNDRAETYDPQTRDGSWSFHKIVGYNVRKVARPDDWTIEITFENNFRVIIRSTNGGYESGRVVAPGRDARRESQLF